MSHQPVLLRSERAHGAPSEKQLDILLVREIERLAMKLMYTP